MNKKLFTAGLVSLGIAVVFVALNLTKIVTSLGDSFLVNVIIYPAAFFAILGVILIFRGLRIFRKN
jgi:hypothetical protein